MRHLDWWRISFLVLVVFTCLVAVNGYIARQETGRLADRVISAQLDVNKERRVRLTNDLKDLKNQHPPPDYRDFIQERIDLRQKELDRLDANNKALLAEQARIR